MRSPVYRNLDRPFQIFGLNIIELMVLCVALVGGGELARALSIARIWAFIFTFLLALIFFWTRRALGDLFARRFLRFVRLPNWLSVQLFHKCGGP